MPPIETLRLGKRFGGFEAVQDLTLQIHEGSIFGLLGPNGAGKSTLLRILTTLLVPTSGTARVNGYDVCRDPMGVRRSIGMVPQGATLDPDLTAWENLDFQAGLHSIPRRERRLRADRLLEDFGLADRRDSLVCTYSGGMRRRLEIARGLLHDPPVLILDEPTSGLDPASRTALWRLLRSLREQRRMTMLLTTHSIEEAESVCEEVGILSRGRLVVAGKLAELRRATPGLPTLSEIYLHYAGPVGADGSAAA